MLEEQINELRKKLDNAFYERRDYSEIYSLSIELDELIAQYYRENSDKKIETKIISKADFEDEEIEKIGSLVKLKKEEAAIV